MVLPAPPHHMPRAARGLAHGSRETRAAGPGVAAGVVALIGA